MITRREELWRHVELVVSGAPHRVHPEVLVTLVQELHRRNPAGVRCVVAASCTGSGERACLVCWALWWLCRKCELYVALVSRAAMLVICAVNETAAPSNVLAISAGSATKPTVVLWN